MLKNLIWGAENNGTVRVDDFPSQPPTLYTVVICTQNFAGTVLIQGSIYEDPQDDDWFDLHTETYTKPGYADIKFINRFFNCKGRYINMRAIVTPQPMVNLGRVDRIVVNT
jgi:hypothetical protein